jgi:phage terminase small subunit
MIENMTKPKPMPRSRVREALQSVPLETILGKAHKALTPKQRKFALEVAKGNTKADAYRAAYNVTSANSMAKDPYTIAKDPRVRQEIEAIELAIAAQEYQTPAALRQLVIHSLVKVIVDPESKPGQVTAAAKVLGTVTEVAAFTERKEVRTISSSESARNEILQQLKDLVRSDATDIDSVELSADSLLAELTSARTPESGHAADNSSPAETHPSPTPQTTQQESRPTQHTIPLKRSASQLERSLSESDFQPELDSDQSMEDPPLSFGEKEGGGV